MTKDNPYYECGEGWHPIIDKAVAKIRKYHPDVEFLQIKEKFGGLRIYTSYTSPAIEAIIELADEFCEETCEQCGKPGNLRMNGKRSWVKTMCAECAGDEWVDYSFPEPGGQKGESGGS
ncbi:MAG: hypothetical protein GTN64_05660 [Candidatus Latescibacteria bacterium]|nr:hypothetical protein [Candidatus Latescibacterota bacterium]NIO78096.1 hypothetical protein [Candidatus Latescibacterota bacterium]